MNSSQSFVYLKYFFLFVGAFIISALLVRTAVLIHDSTFTDYHYNVLVLSKKSYVVGINNKSKTLSVIEIQKDRDKLSRQNILKDSLLVGIPLNAVIEIKNGTEFNEFSHDFFSLKQMLAVAFDEYHFFLNGLNSVDVLKIFFSVNGIKESSRQDVSIGELKEIPQKSEDIFQIFKDTVIFNEKNSVEIVNTTDVDGLGNRVRRMFENNGVNVISVASDDEIPISKMIIRVEDNNTTRFLRTVLPFRIEQKKETAVADITIVLGKDYSNKIE